MLRWMLSGLLALTQQPTDAELDEQRAQAHVAGRAPTMVPVDAQVWEDAGKAPSLQRPRAPNNSKLRKARGVIHRVESSSEICDTDRDIIQGMSRWRIGDCRAVLFRLVTRRGDAVDLVDLVLTTDDENAIIDEHIPFGLIDPLEHGIVPSDGEPLAHGVVSYETVQTRHGSANVIRSFASFPSLKP